jgi:hypothetical protein
MDLAVVLKRFERPDEVREFEKGRFELLHLGGMTIGRATYQPGWKWSEHVGKTLGERYCQVEHVGMVVSGCATAAMADGEVFEMRAATTAGSSVTDPTCRCISSAPATTPPDTRTESSVRAPCPKS